MKVSVLMITYNHEQFIAQAIESILMQQVSFEYEIVIGEDCSTDRTRDIIISYRKKYSDKIRALLHEKNIGMQKNFVQTYKACQGKYIGLCEGDDYWTDPSKLQKQVDFLEANPDFSICFHKVKILEDNQLKDDYITQVPSTTSTILELARGNYIHTLSCVFRNNISNIFGPHFASSPLGDYYLHMMNARHGKIYYINEILGVYRVHNTSIWSRQSEIYRYYKTLESIRYILLDLSDVSLQVHKELKFTYINLVINIYKNFSNDPCFDELIPDNIDNYTIKLVVDEIVRLKEQQQKYNSFFGLLHQLFSMFMIRMISKMKAVT